MPPGVPPQVAGTGDRDPVRQQRRVPAQQRRGDRLGLRVEHLLVGGGEGRADVVGQALVRDPVHRHPGLAVLDDVPAQLIQHPAHVVTAEPAVPDGVGAGQPLLLRQPRAQPQVSAASKSRADSRGGRAAAISGRPGARTWARSASNASSTEWLTLSCQPGWEVSTGADTQLVGDQPGQQERAAAGHRRFPGQLAGDRIRVHPPIHAGQPPGDVGAHVRASAFLRGRVVQVQLRGAGGQHVQQRRLGLTAPQLPGRHDHHRVRRQPQQQFLRDRERVAARLIQPVHHDHRRGGTLLHRALHLPDQLGGVPPFRLRGQHARPHQLAGDRVGGPVRGQPPGVHVRSHRPFPRVSVPYRSALGQQPLPFGRVGQAHYPPGDRGLPRARRSGDHMQARLTGPDPGDHLVHFGGPPGEPGVLVRPRAAPGGQQQVLHHPFGRARVIPRVGEHPPRAPVAQEIRAMRRGTPGLQDRIAQVIAADERALRRPALYQQRPRVGSWFRPGGQQLGQPLAEHPVAGHLRRKARRQHPHPHVLVLRAGTAA